MENENLDIEQNVGSKIENEQIDPNTPIGEDGEPIPMYKYKDDKRGRERTRFQNHMFKNMNKYGEITPVECSRLYRKDGSSFIVNLGKHIRNGKPYKNPLIQKKLIERLIANMPKQEAVKAVQEEEAKIEKEG
jgi:hypothetical protein